LHNCNNGAPFTVSEQPQGSFPHLAFSELTYVNIQLANVRDTTETRSRCLDVRTRYGLPGRHRGWQVSLRCPRSLIRSDIGFASRHSLLTRATGFCGDRHPRSIANVPGARRRPIRHAASSDRAIGQTRPYAPSNLVEAASPRVR